MGGLSKEGSDGSGVLAEGQQEPQRTTRAGLEGWTSEAPAGQEPWRTTRAGLEGWTKRAPAHLESQQRDRELWIGSSNGLLLPGGDYDFELRLEKSFITAAAGCAQIPCAFTIPVRVYPVQKIWFRGSPEFPLSPPMVEEQANLMWPLRSPEHECSIILWDFSGHERIEEYGLMLKWGTNETHIYDERITVSYSTAHPQILNSSACSLQKVLLTCVCVSQGVPLPDIHWPLQSNADSNIVRTSDGHITVRSTYTMTVEDLTSISSPVCVSKNKLGQTKMTLPVNINKVKEAA
ncbi:sialic acid-binding Ig-like lectin 6 [Labeo rohita]|uniref:Sialic acid-binding Ig-like lectin 6 n=1 Tax=Labeo rohita TaxID=84645 RepID=A0A498M165_LABRO|nr:sialic acid-binding Ig-like lectin 6 [Labeo rohita]